MDQLNSQYKREGLTIVDENGKEWNVGGGGDGSTGIPDKILKGLTSGKYRYKKKGEYGDGEYWTGQDPKDKAIANPSSNKQNAVSGTLKVVVDSSGKALVPREVELSPHQERVNQGFGTETLNNPPPGESSLKPRYIPGVGVEWGQY